MRSEADLRDMMRALAHDVTRPEEFVVRCLPSHRPRPRIGVAVLAAAVVIVLIALVTSLAVLGRGHDAAPVGPGPSAVATAASLAPHGTSVPTTFARRAVPTGWRTEHDGVVVHYPQAWVVTKYTGAPATVASPLFYLSEHRLPGRCPGHADDPSDSTGTGTACFDGTFTVPTDGVVIEWRETELPNSTWFRLAPGTTTTIDKRVAKIYSGAPAGGVAACAPGAASEINAVINMTRQRYVAQHASDDFVMTACLGPHAPAADRTAVYTMLATMRVDG